ncbi:MAG: hypothetical protein Q9191_001155 [Dirinaria sp. TL-2023a]
MLAENREIVGDPLLAQYARLQLIDNKIAQVPGLEKVCEKPTAAKPGAGKTPWPFYLRALQAELRSLRDAMPPHLQSNQARIHEMAFSKSTSHFQDMESLRIESLYSALEATKKWFDIYCTFPPAHHFRFTIAITTQLAHSIIILYRLETFDHPGWDRELVRQVCNLTDILSAVTERMGQVQSAAGLEYDPSHTTIWELNVRKMSFIKTWWQAKEHAENPRPPSAPPAIEAARAAPMAIPSETWLNDMFMLEDFQFENYDFPNTDGCEGSTSMSTFGL